MFFFFSGGIYLLYQWDKVIDLITVHYANIGSKFSTENGMEIFALT